MPSFLLLSSPNRSRFQCCRSIPFFSSSAWLSLPPLPPRSSGPHPLVVVSSGYRETAFFSLILQAVRLFCFCIPTLMPNSFIFFRLSIETAGDNNDSLKLSHVCLSMMVVIMKQLLPFTHLYCNSTLYKMMLTELVNNVYWNRDWL